MGDPNFVFEYEGQAYSPEDISSFILRKVVGDAEIALGASKITDVVITCPAYFGTPEREATANAGRLAGLNVRAILNEPTAAAIAYGLEQGEDQTVLVYDLGGGTFDITMIEIKDRLIRVICTGGDHRLGGALWDEAIVMYLAEQFRTQTGEESDPLDDPEVLNDLFLQAERGKKTLTQRDKAPFRVTHAGQQARVELDRAKFEEITKHLLDRTIELTHEMLADARAKGHTKFDKIILVGGATRMPQVHNRLVAEFNMEPEIYDPDEAVAKGAALYGLKESLHDEVQEILASRRRRRLASRGRADRPERGLRGAGRPGARPPGEAAWLHPHRPGPRAGQHPDRQRPVQEPGRRRPRRAEQGRGRLPAAPQLARCRWSGCTDFGTDADNQAAVDIRVMAGERDSPEPLDCQEVGVATLNLPEKLPARSPIRVKFAINQDGRLSVSATDLTGGGSIDVEFETEAVMNAEEVAERSTALRLLNVS